MNELSTGVSVVTNDGLNPPTFPKVAGIREALSPAPGSLEEWTSRMEALLLDRTPPNPVPEDTAFGLPLEVRSALHSVFVDLPHYGTVSSAIAWMDSEGLAGYRVRGGRSESFQEVLPSP